MQRFCSIIWSSGALVSTEGRPSQEGMFWRRLLKVATEVAEWRDSGRLLQREGVQELNALVPALVLILGTDRVIPFFDLSERAGRDHMYQENPLT